MNDDDVCVKFVHKRYGKEVHELLAEQYLAATWWMDSHRYGEYSKWRNVTKCRKACEF